MLLDDIDKKLLAIMQEDASLSVAQLAERVGLTTTPCWRRLQRLEREGYIRARVALLDPQKLGLGLSVFVLIRTAHHTADWLEQFSRTVSAFPEVVEVNRLAGEYDYLLRVVTRDIASYDRFYKRLIEAVDLSDVTSSFSMEEIKYATALPLDEH
ncbi:Lrp/AsnC family transcriptional regulator [Kaustia mangrovi]|uniref:Lrp/AsnC family transcriptional regulator n=1 Tax=Kaustia mangrovi TaxID=2593653 RepID=A0A7S8C5J7_9HYPH|nr:Lrp/AsnC family transcriptional regulator [Kaustia mangrovi]QPC43778.1 Lrp/AsnC family transcriptional regulator [Kaustia mangrovi]